MTKGTKTTEGEIWKKEKLHLSGFNPASSRWWQLTVLNPLLWPCFRGFSLSPIFVHNSYIIWVRYCVWQPYRYHDQYRSACPGSLWLRPRWGGWWDEEVPSTAPFLGPAEGPNYQRSAVPGTHQDTNVNQVSERERLRLSKSHIKGLLRPSPLFGLWFCPHLT